MFLPKGSTVVLNVWAMHHDSGTWKDPQHFVPERFESYHSLASTYAASGKWDERDHYGYGAGRRICPGELIAKILPSSTINARSYEMCHGSNALVGPLGLLFKSSGQPSGIIHVSTGSVLTLNHPGIHLAERNLFIGVAKLLWAFKFSVKRGEEINTSAETGLSQGFLHCVKEYGSSITLRSEARRDTILREFEEAQATFAMFE